MMIFLTELKSIELIAANIGNGYLEHTLVKRITTLEEENSRSMDIKVI